MSITIQKQIMNNKLISDSEIILTIIGDGWAKHI